MDYLNGKTAIITGASKGIGKELARQLALKGMKLCLVARTDSFLKELKKEIHELGANCLCIAGSIAYEGIAQQIAETCFANFGKIDFAINNAGYGIFKDFSLITGQEWEDLFNTNVKGTFNICKAVSPYMEKEKKGHIINIASDVAKRVFAQGSLYCSSKYAQDAFSMAIRKELRPKGIKVSVIYSGLVDTMFHKDEQGHTSHKEWLKVEDMAQSIIHVMNQAPHVVIDELMIHPLSQEY